MAYRDKTSRGGTDAECKKGMKILIATDGSEFSMVALRSVAERPWPAGSEVRVISVPEFLPLREFSYLNAREVEDLGRASEEEAAICAAKGVEVLSSPILKVCSNVPIVRDRTFQVILDEAEKWKADVIVLGSHGRSGFDRMVMGSVSESVALHARCSVEVIARPHSDAVASNVYHIFQGALSRKRSTKKSAGTRTSTIRNTATFLPFRRSSMP